MRSFKMFTFLYVLSLSNLSAQVAEKEWEKTDFSDFVLVKVYYAFAQTADNKLNDNESKIDTMRLDVGTNLSAFYDPSLTVKNAERESKMQHIKSLNVVKENFEGAIERLNAKQTNEIVIKSNEGISFSIYKDRRKSKVYTTDKNTNGSRVLLAEKLPPQDWEILNDTCRVLGYDCQKATTYFRGRQYTVCFTSSIPTNEGPWKLYGLPGLILKAETADGLFSFTAIGLQKASGENLTNDFSELANGKYETCKDLKQYQNFVKNKAKDAYIGFIRGGDAVLYRIGMSESFIALEID